MSDERMSDAELSGIPFGGAGLVFHFRDPEELPLFRQAVQALMDCEHLHNFMVQSDGLRLYTSDLGAGCVKKALNL